MLGYWALCLDLEAVMWGAWASRYRMYWAGLRGLRQQTGVSRWFLDVLNGLKPSEPDAVFEPKDFLSLTNLDRRRDSERLRISTRVACGTRLSMAKKVDPDYINT